MNIDRLPELEQSSCSHIWMYNDLELENPELFSKYSKEEKSLIEFLRELNLKIISHPYSESGLIIDNPKEIASYYIEHIARQRKLCALAIGSTSDIDRIKVQHFPKYKTISGKGRFFLRTSVINKDTGRHNFVRKRNMSLSNFNREIYLIVEDEKNKD